MSWAGRLGLGARDAAPGWRRELEGRLRHECKGSRSHAETPAPDSRRACLERAATAMGDQLRDGDELVAFTATVRTRDGRQEHLTVSPDLWWSS